MEETKTLHQVLKDIDATPAEYWQEQRTKIKEVAKEKEKNAHLVYLREEILTHLARKELGKATEVLVQTIERENHIFTTKVDKAPEIYIYNDGIYLPNGASEIKEQIRRILLDDYTEYLNKLVLDKIVADTFITPELLFQEDNKKEIPVGNGILNLDTFELSEFTPDKIFLSKLPTKFNIEATCPLIDKFLSEVLASPEDKDVFYELAGFGLCKDYFMEKAFMFVGNGRNGKGKSIELLKRLVGTSNCASVPLSALEVNSPFVSSLWKRYFNLAGDLSNTSLKETGLFKMLTGRDPVSANRKYLNVIEFTNYAKLVFACNSLPKVYDTSDGFWERWVLLEYPYKFVEQDVYDQATEEEKKMLKIKDNTIIDKITTEEEMSGFLNLALLGLKRLLDNKRFSYTKGTVEVKNRWIRKADSFMAFCMDCIEENWERKVTKKELRQKFKKYCEKHKVEGSSDKAIKVVLQELFGVSEEFIKLYEQANQEWVWTGIKFKMGLDL
jgi:P4 family phage/plasmid primase-like protien